MDFQENSEDLLRRKYKWEYETWEKFARYQCGVMFLDRLLVDQRDKNVLPVNSELKTDDNHFPLDCTEEDLNEYINSKLEHL